MKNKFYYESVGECVSQVYEIENVKTWDEAKKAAFDEMKEGDRLAECPANAIEYYGDYADINKSKCENYATLQKGTWAERLPSGEEYREDDAWFFDDCPNEFYNGNFGEFDAWEEDREDD